MNLISTVCPLSKRLKKPEKGRLITMEVLDRVYSAFSNLDRDFARSKKSRTDFILEKFGGDIDMGSMIILDAISASTGEETAEDIQKLTFVKEIFEKLKDARDNLDSLPYSKTLSSRSKRAKLLARVFATSCRVDSARCVRTPITLWRRLMD